MNEVVPILNGNMPLYIFVRAGYIKKVANELMGKVI
jgi:hypothetical protein